MVLIIPGIEEKPLPSHAAAGRGLKCHKCPDDTTFLLLVVQRVLWDDLSLFTMIQPKHKPMKTQNHVILSLVLVVCLALSSGFLSAATLHVDLDVGSDIETQSGYESWVIATTDSPGSFGSLNISNSFAYSQTTGGSLGVTMTTGGNTFGRKYPEATSPSEAAALSALIRDVVFFNDGLNGDNFFQVTLSNLLAGEYEFTGYHNATNRLVEADNATTTIFINGESTGQTATFVSPPQSGTSGVMPAGAPSTQTFSFTVANDGDAVVIRYQNPTAENFGLNGFDLVPEPTTALLGALGMLVLLRRRRR